MGRGLVEPSSHGKPHSRPTWRVVHPTTGCLLNCVNQENSTLGSVHSLGLGSDHSTQSHTSAKSQSIHSLKLSKTHRWSTYYPRPSDLVCLGISVPMDVLQMATRCAEMLILWDPEWSGWVLYHPALSCSSLAVSYLTYHFKTTSSQNIIFHIFHYELKMSGSTVATQPPHFMDETLSHFSQI